MKTFKIPFAFDKAGNLYDCNTAVKGIDYFCQCGDVVRIRGGEIMSDHFYHINETECSNESAIHKAYKSVLFQQKKIMLPDICNGKEMLEFDSVELEKKINDFQPDAIGFIGNDRYLIEFAKTSYIGENKLKKIKRSNLFCLEISILSDVKTIQDIVNHLTVLKYYKEFIHVPTFRELEDFKEKERQAYVALRAKHREEIMAKDKRINELERELYSQKNEEDKEIINLLGKGVYLAFNKISKNGAKFFKNRDLNLIAFLNDKSIFVKL